MVKAPISINKLAVVVHTCNPNYMGGISRRIMVWVWPGQKSMRPYLKKN
jgi:hypothetical protein